MMGPPLTPKMVPTMTDPTASVGEPDLFPEQDDDFAREKQPITARGVAIVGGRVATGLIGIGVAVAAIAAATFIPLPTVQAVPGSMVITPVPTAQQLVCPGAILRLADDSGQGATTASAIGRPSIDSSSSVGQVASSPLDQSDASTGATASAPTIISALPDQADPAAQILLSGAQAQLSDEGDFVGLTAAGCATVSGDVWLAAGSTSVGRTTLLTLSNPTEVPATVNIELYGENGRVTAPGTSGIVVPASGQRVISLAGFQPDLASTVVHVTSSGGQVVAALQQSTVRGLVPGGIDIVGPTVAPQLDTVIPGVLVTDLVAVQELQGGGEAFEDLRTVIRLFAPGEGTIPVTISVVSEDGAAPGASFVFQLDAGRVVDLPVGELDNGSYTVRASAEVPTLATVRVSSAVAEATDFAWLVAAPELPAPAQLTIAPGPSPQLHLYNPTDVDITVVLTATEGGDLSVPVPARTAAVVPVTAGASYVLSGYEKLQASVTVVEGGMIAGYTVHPPGVGSSPLTIYR